MVTNVTSLLKTVKAVEDEATKGTRALEATTEHIRQELAVSPPVQQGLGWGAGPGLENGAWAGAAGPRLENGAWAGEWSELVHVTIVNIFSVGQVLPLAPSPLQMPSSSNII